MSGNPPPRRTRVLVVEDDLRVAGALVAGLRLQGFEVLPAYTAAEALAAPTVDLVLLDLCLPDAKGVDLCRRLRASGADMGVIAVTSLGETHDRVAGLHAGADDYMVKPISMPELCARIEAVLRRVRPRPEGPFVIGGLRVDPAARAVTRDGRAITLTRKEFDLLTCLARAAGTVVPRRRLFAEVWGTTWRGVGRALDVHMATLRAKLGDPPLIETERGVGYRLPSAAA
ncbi:response regulator transcription factor [Spongiactinospora sp. TRM90649]|uniref:response regulator transcription factor n=1 Tax=Spongiactinospora sp. TRM90649 TaxID=3031114 RepID=UPI0023F9077B|nr:response regulator transcription factor [Spongiactinospora sp. TRM90649]MDF5755849.1 response regulator transcription factor [Spongiactinospora sp. TRM90649]